MNLCPACSLCYEETHNLCAHDESPLVKSHPATRLIAKKYKLDWLIGRGRLGAVYEGTHTETDRRVAIRLLSPNSVIAPEALKQFRSEAHAVAHLNTRIDHQHVARTYDYGTLGDGTPYIVTELVKGQPLHEFMQSAGRLRLDEAASIARQVANSLEAAHRSGIVHGDLNPSNVFVSRDRHGRPEVKVLDFALAKLRPLAATGEDRDSHRAQVGDSHYLSPEQRSGRRPDERSDVYSLGAILYETLTGMPLLRQTAHKHGVSQYHQYDEELTPLTELREDVPEQLWRLIKQSLEVKPAARPTEAEFARQMHALGGGEAHNSNSESGSVIPAAQTAADAIPLLATSGDAVRPTAPLQVSTQNQTHYQELMSVEALLGQEEVCSTTEYKISEMADTPFALGASRNRLSALSLCSPAPLNSSSDASPSTRVVVATHTKPPVVSRFNVSTISLIIAAVLGILTGLWAARVRARSSPTFSSSVSNRTDAPARPPYPLTPPAAAPPAAKGEATAQVSGAKPLAAQEAGVKITKEESASGSAKAARTALRAVFEQWLAAINERALEKQIGLYMTKVDSFYSLRDAPLGAVRAHRSRLFTGARSIDMSAGAPNILIDRDGRKATMRFRKQWVIKGRSNSTGEAVQELRLIKTDAGWKIVSERNVRDTKVAQEGKEGGIVNDRRVSHVEKKRRSTSAVSPPARAPTR